MNIGQDELITRDGAAALERARLVRLCTHLTGDREAAEDLAQETLLAGWRLAFKLRDESGRFPWLAAIALNLCRRWERRRRLDGNRFRRLDSGLAWDGVESTVGIDALDGEIDLDRHELALLLDKALALLPPDTGQALIERYVHESSYAEIAARLGVSADAVGMRLSRGKLHLRRLLTQELHAEAAAFGLCKSDDAGWEETRIWCLICGRHRLLGLVERPAGRLAYRCPGCTSEPAIILSEYRLANPTFGRLVADLSRYKPMLNRTLTWADSYFRPSLTSGTVVCTACGQPTPLRQAPPAPDMSIDRLPRLVARCATCGETSSTSLTGIVLAHPAVRQFWRQHPRMRTLPVREVDIAGSSALLIRVEAVTETAGLNIISDRDTYAVLEADPDGAVAD